MIRMPVNELKAGMTVARPIINPSRPQNALLKRGFTLTTSSIRGLRRLRVHDIWVMDEQLDFLDDIIDKGVEGAHRKLLVSVKENFEKAMSGNVIDISFSTFRHGIEELIKAIRGSKTNFMLLQNISSYDNYLYMHSTNVCYAALLLGMNLEDYITKERMTKGLKYLHASELKNLGLGALLHDIGKTRIESEILDKPDTLTKEEYREIMNHTLYGYELLKDCVEASAAHVALNHHQRWNGTGYPRLLDKATGKPRPPLAGKKINIFCRVVSIPDVYDAGTSDHYHKIRKLPIKVLFEMRFKKNIGWFDPEVEKAFHRITPPFQLGTIAVLNTGDTVIVTDFNSAVPCKPRVTLYKNPKGERYPPAKSKEIDLSRNKSLFIRKYNGKNVERYLY